MGRPLRDAAQGSHDAVTLTYTWIDRERDPQCPPDRAFPNGIDLDMSAGAAKTCSVEVPYPAKRCGIYVVECSECGQRNAITTAGRPDDPRKITFGCYAHRLCPNPPGLTEVVLPDSERTKRTPHI